jgi:virulence-associated protein VapD
LFAVAFDLVIADVERHHPKGVPQAYNDVAKTLAGYGFRWAQGSVYLTDDESLANLVEALTSLRMLPWFPFVVRDMRAFRVENWSDFTPFMKKAGP